MRGKIGIPKDERESVDFTYGGPWYLEYFSRRRDQEME